MKRTLSFLLFASFLGAGFVSAQAPNIDALPPRSFLRIGTAKLRHGDRILCLAYSPDGAILAAGGGNDPLRLWNPKTGDLIKVINEPWVHALAYTTSGATLIFGGYQKHIRLWNFQLNKETGRLEGHKTGIKAIAVSSDTSLIASGSQDGAIILWILDTNSKHVELKGHDDEITALAFSPKDSNLLASAGSDRVIHLWSVETNQSKMKLDAGCGVLALAFSPDGKTLYSAGDDNLIRRWDVANGKQTGTFKGHDGTIVSLIARGDTLISGGLDKTIRFWDAKSTNQLRSLPRSQGDCDALAMTQAGDFLATAGLNNTIRIFAAATGKEVIPAPGVQSGLVGLTISSDHKRLASVTSDGQILVWDAKTGKLHKQWDVQQSGDSVLAFAPDGKTLATASSTVRLWDADTGAEVAQILTRPLDPVVSLAFSPDGKTLALGLRSAQIELWNVTERSRAGSLKYPGSLHAIAWSPDGKKLAAAGGPKIFVWDPHTNALLKTFDVKEGPPPVFPTVRALAFAPDSKLLAAGGWDAVVRVYNINAKNPTDAKEQRVCEGHLSAVFSVAFSADGRSLLTGSFDRTVRLWEAFSGKQITQYKGHVGAVHGVAFLGDGRSFYSAGTDASVFLWDVPGLSNNGKLPELTLTVQELDSAWDILATEETPRGQQKMWQCIASAKQALPHLTNKLYFLDPDNVKKLFRELDSNHFPTRLAAMNKLTAYGRWMEGRYDAAMATSPSLEYKRRVEILKEKLTATNSPSLAQERLRVRRIMQMCEQVGSAEAIDALRQLADKGPEEELREEAKASLQRLKK